ncbi:MAG: hypothetical protein VB017_05395 [Endomicrobiaceae bacterium]|nr:hypothetical protein [Endomicrobiaceae bacterium]
MCKKVFIFIFLLSAVSFAYADVPNEIRYNGKIKEYRVEVNGTRNINFKIYDTLTGGTAKWESGSKSVIVSSGIFSYTLSPDISLVDWRGKDYYLEIEIDGKKLEPREKLTAVPYALHSNTAENIIIENGSEFSVTIGSDKNFTVNSSDGPKAVVSSTEYYMVPKGAIIIWSGAIDKIPSGWVLCDGTNGTPNLTDRFVLGAGNSYSVGTTGGEAEHTLTISEMPSHSHTIAVQNNSENGSSNIANTVGSSGSSFEFNNTWTTNDSGNSLPHNNMPPYYSLCYIMKE